MNLAAEWTAFAGFLFALMGTSLGAAARRNAEDALAWERQWRAAVGAPESSAPEEPRRRRLALAYRLGGAFFAAAGVSLIVIASTGRAPFSAPAGKRELLAGGLFFTTCGLILAVGAALRAGRRAPRFLAGELLADDASASTGERVAAACSRGMIALFLVFGARLLREGLR